MLDIFKYCEEQKTENVIISHRGTIDGEIIDILLQLTDKKLAALKTKKKTKKKIINILVECLQNSFHYSLENKGAKDLLDSTFLVIIRENDKFVVFAGNNITVDRAEKLKSKIDKIKTMSDSDLQSRYIQGLNKEHLPIEGGAGLGLMDIARRSDKNMSYLMNELENGYWFFALQVEIQS